MRDEIIRYKGILKGNLIIGAIFLFIGLTYFLGIFEIDFEYSLIGAPVNSLYGITYLTLYALGFYLVILALLLILPTLSKISRKALKKYRGVFILFEILGLGLILYSFLVNISILPTLGSTHTWFDYFTIGIIISFSNYLVIIFSTENFQDLSSLKKIWILVISIGIIIEFLSLLAYWSLLQIIGVSTNSWGDLYLFGLVFLFMGGLPFLLSCRDIDMRISTGLGILSIILITSGIVTYLAPTFALNSMLFPLSIFTYNKYFDYLFFGSLLLIIGISTASNFDNTQKYLKKFPELWIFFLILGFFQCVISLLMEITDSFFIDLGLDFLFLKTAYGSSLMGMTGNVFLINGFITTLSALIILSSLILRETTISDELQESEM